MKQGVSRKLMDFAKDYSLQRAVKSIRLDIAFQNTTAIYLYEKCGYKYIGTVDLGLGYEHLKWFKMSLCYKFGVGFIEIVGEVE